MDLVRQLGLKIIEVPADGNCLLHCLTYHLTKYPLHSHQFFENSCNLRMQIVSYLRAHLEEYHPYLIGKYLGLYGTLPQTPGTCQDNPDLAVNLYLSEMERDGVYYDEESLQVVCELFKVELKVIQVEGGNLLTFGGGNLPSYYLLRSSNPEHYRALVSGNGMGSTRLNHCAKINFFYMVQGFYKKCT